jgi:hypothetical protein
MTRLVAKAFIYSFASVLTVICVATVVADRVDRKLRPR